MDWRIGLVLLSARARRRRRRRCAAIWLAAIAGMMLLGIYAERRARCRGTPLRTARCQLDAVAQAVEQYRVLERRCPRDIDTLVTRGLLRRTPTDPWGSAFRMECTRDARPYVWSAGPDRRFGTADDLDSSGMR